MNKSEDNFLLNLGKYCSKIKQKGTVYLTLKRCKLSHIGQF